LISACGDQGRIPKEAIMNKRILIIDDEENIRRMVRLTLESAGYEVGEAGDGIQGLDLYANGSNWDAVLLDERMPGKDGLETLRSIKGRNPNARVIMVTAYASIELAVDAMKLGAADFLRKPMTPEILRGALETALSKQVKSSVAPAPAVDQGPLPRSPPIETITLNGFEIIRPTDAGASIRTKPDEHGFIVKSPDKRQFQVVVQIDEAAIGFVERLTHRRLPANNSFWTYAAERFLSDYLWKEGKVPPGGRLKLKEISREEMLTAGRWEKD
jgi:CheY-like chemotaxis protein